MESNELKNGHWILLGLICTLIGIVLFATPVALLGFIMTTIGLIMMFAFGMGGSTQSIQYRIETHDQHLHYQQHNYPVQRVTEGREYSVTRPDGTVTALRLIRRSE